LGRGRVENKELGRIGEEEGSGMCENREFVCLRKRE
jgi:hypothetical protein